MKAFKHKGQSFAVFLVSVCCASCPSWIDPHCSSCFCWYLTFNRILIKEQLRVIFWDKKFRIRLAAWTWVTLICVGSGGSHAGRLISWSRQFSQYLFWFLNQSRHNNYLHRWPFDLIFLAILKRKKPPPSFLCVGVKQTTPIWDVGVEIIPFWRNYSMKWKSHINEELCHWGSWSGIS